MPGQLCVFVTLTLLGNKHTHTELRLGLGEVLPRCWIASTLRQTRCHTPTLATPWIDDRGGFVTSPNFLMTLWRALFI